MESQKARAIVFDLFHTLVDPEDFRPKEFRRAAVVARLLNLDEARFLSYWEGTASVRLSTPRREIEYVKDFVAQIGGRNASESSLAEAEDALGRYQDIAILNPRQEVLATIRSLRERGYKLGLLSNTHERDVREWPRSPLATLFDAAVFSHEIGIAKPNPGAYHAVLGRLGLANPSGCVFVGDGGSEELMGAKKAGFKSAVFMRRFVSSNGLRSKEQLDAIANQADLVVDSFHEFSKLVL